MNNEFCQHGDYIGSDTTICRELENDKAFNLAEANKLWDAAPALAEWDAVEGVEQDERAWPWRLDWLDENGWQDIGGEG